MVGLLDEDECRCVSSELDFNSLPPTNTSYAKQYYEKLDPTASPNSGTLQFSMKTNPRDFIALNESFLYLRAKITTADGSLPAGPAPAAGAAAPDIPASSKVLPSNYLIATLFKNVKVFVNGLRISETNDLYPYKAYLEYLLSYDKVAQENYGPVTMFYRDPDKKFDFVTYDANGAKVTNTTLTAADSGGLYKRFERTQYGKTFELHGRLHSDFCTTDRLFPGDLPITIELDRADEKFSLMSPQTTSEYRIKIEEAIFYVKRKRLTDSAYDGLAISRLENNLPLKYNFSRVDMKYSTFGPNKTVLQATHVINNTEMPKRVMLALVDQEAFSGNYQFNPFNFKNFGVKEIELKINDGGTPFLHYEMDYTNNMYHFAYLGFLRSLGALFKNEQVSISPIEFKENYCIYGFDLTKNDIDSGTFELRENGALSIDIKLSKSLPYSLALVIYLEYDSLLLIAPNNVTTLHSVPISS